MGVRAKVQGKYGELDINVQGDWLSAWATMEFGGNKYDVKTVYQFDGVGWLRRKAPESSIRRHGIIWDRGWWPSDKMQERFYGDMDAAVSNWLFGNEDKVLRARLDGIEAAYLSATATLMEKTKEMNAAQAECERLADVRQKFLQQHAGKIAPKE